MIVFPASNTNSILVGALFLTNSFPAFVLDAWQKARSLPIQIHPGYATHDQEPISMQFVTTTKNHQLNNALQSLHTLPYYTEEYPFLTRNARWS